jgi:hypothetical protein
MKQTAVQRLIEQLKFTHKEAYNDLYEVIQQAKQMEKEQIKGSWNHGFDWGMMEQSLAEQGAESTLIDAEHYYKETYED